MAIPTGIAGRHVRMARNVDKRVAVAAVQPDLIDVNLVREGNRLRGLVAHRQGFRRRVISESERNSCCCGSGADGDFQWQQIGPAGKNVCHGKGDAVRRSEIPRIHHGLVTRGGSRPSVRREDANPSIPCNGKKNFCGIL